MRKNRIQVWVLVAAGWMAVAAACKIEQPEPEALPEPPLGELLTGTVKITGRVACALVDKGCEDLHFPWLSFKAIEEPATISKIIAALGEQTRPSRINNDFTHRLQCHSVMSLRLVGAGDVTKGEVSCISSPGSKAIVEAEIFLGQKAEYRLEDTESLWEIISPLAKDRAEQNRLKNCLTAGRCRETKRKRP